MPIPPRNRRAFRAAAASLGAAGLIALARAPAAFGDETDGELLVGGLEPVGGVNPGSTFDLPVVVANKITVPVDKVWITYSVTRGLDYADVPSNCRVQQVRSYDEMPERRVAVCGFDQRVEPGAVYTPEKSLRAKVLDRGLYEEVRARAGFYEPQDDENGYPPVTGTAPAVKLVPAPSGGEEVARRAYAPVTVVNTADYQVTGDALKGKVGDTVTMKATFTNAGPAWVLTREGDKSVSVKITLPAGTSVVKRGQFCRPDGKVYCCGMRSLYDGSHETYAFQLKIDKKVPGAKGSVALSTEARPFDHDKANDKAAITLDVTGGGSTGSTGGSSSGSTGSTGGSAGSTGSSTNGSTGSKGGTTGGSTGSTGGSSTAGSSGTTGGGNLAETGSSVLPLAGAAAAAVAAGTGAVLVVRRRRAQS